LRFGAFRPKFEEAPLLAVDGVPTVLFLGVLGAGLIFATSAALALRASHSAV
jgi:hypothetical protein